MNPSAHNKAIHFDDLSSFVKSAASAARLAQPEWAATAVSERLARVRKLRHLIAENASVLAKSSASARHRPSIESMTAEVLPLAEACRFLEREAESLLVTRRFGSRGRPLWLSNVQSEIRREPFGVVLIIGPGNYPLLLPGVQLIQALVAGNAVLLKPGVGGSAAAQALVDLLELAGFNPDLVGLLPEATEAAQIAIEVGPDKVLFTGSAATGEKILAQLAPHLTPATMELSGCDAVIVRADADLDLTVKALVFGLTLNGGATCMAPKRVFVHRSIATELEGRLAAAFPQNIRDGQSHFASATTDQLRPLLDEALARGAHFIAGGIANDNTVHTPIIIGGVTPSARILHADIFAPVLSLITVSDDEEAITRTNNCLYGLGTSIFSRDESVARSIAATLYSGVVSINDLIVPTADARVPFGGYGRSGFGVTRGAEGFLELTRPRVVTVSRGKFRPAFEAPRPGDEAMFVSYLQFTHGSSWVERIGGLIRLLRQLCSRPRLKSRL